MKLSGVQLAIAMRPPRTHYAEQLGGRPLRPRREHGAVHGHRGVKAPVGVRHGFGIAFVELNGQSFALGPLPGGDQQVGGNVQPGHPGAGARGGQRQIPRAAGDIEHRLAVPEAQAVDVRVRTRSVPRSDAVEVSGRPDCAVPRDERICIRSGRTHDAHLRAGRAAIEGCLGCCHGDLS
jgi:hypothetical protein